jgi:hypothetical protein
VGVILQKSATANFRLRAFFRGKGLAYPLPYTAATRRNLTQDFRVL